MIIIIIIIIIIIVIGGEGTERQILNRRERKEGRKEGRGTWINETKENL